METFVQNYKPTRPWASNDVKAEGVRRYGREEALAMKFIEPNVKTMKNLLIVDIDQDNAAWSLKEKIFDDARLPVPAFITTNPISTHAHAGWFIDGVATTPKQIHVFEGLRKKLAIVAGGDPCYSGGIFRNPLADGASTEFFDAERYTFDTLANYTRGTVVRDSKALESEAEGRNVYLFDCAREWAYAAYYRAMKHDGLTYFREDLQNFIIAENSQFDRPLNKSEILSIAYSIEKFVSTRFSLSKFEKKQQAQREKSIAVRKAGAKEKWMAISEIMAAGNSMKLACETMGFNYASVRASWKKWNDQFAG